MKWFGNELFEVSTLKNSDILFKVNELNMYVLKTISLRYKNMGMNITPVQGRIIMAIYDKEVDSCQKDIEQVISCNKSTLSSILNTMEKKELIKRVEFKKDSRRNKIILTDKALKIIKILKKDQIYLSKILTNNITDEEYTYFNGVIEKIKGNIERI